LTSERKFFEPLKNILYLAGSKLLFHNSEILPINEIQRHFPGAPLTPPFLVEGLIPRDPHEPGPQRLDLLGVLVQMKENILDDVLYEVGIAKVFTSSPPHRRGVSNEQLREGTFVTRDVPAQ
jgi:hypothetical protein